MSVFLVTGATGFLGKHLISHLLEEKHQVIVVHRPSATLGEEFQNCHKIPCEMEHYGDLHKLSPLSSIDGVFYLAWAGNAGIQRADPQIQQKNLKAMLDCMESVSQLHCKHFVATGTVSEKLILSDNSAISSQNMLYAASKHSAYLMGAVVSQKYTMDFTWLQLANIYGKGNNTGNLTSYTIEALQKGDVPSFGSATVLQDFMYVKDCVRGIALAGQMKLARKCYFLGSGQPQMLKDYLYQIRDAIDPALELGIGQREDDGTFYPKEWFNLDPFTQETGFTPNYTFETGIQETLQEGK